MEVYDLPFSATQLSNAVFAAQTIEHNSQKKAGA